MRECCSLRLTTDGEQQQGGRNVEYLIGPEKPKAEQGLILAKLKEPKLNGSMRECLAGRWE